MLMEDLTSSYKRPSVLDLKMGTQVSRTSGCTPEKKRKHLELTNSCSTGPIKARLAGMQVQVSQFVIKFGLGLFRLSMFELVKEKLQV